MKVKQNSSKKHLIIAATAMEASILLANSEHIKVKEDLYQVWQGTQLLITGVGQYNAIFHLMSYLRTYGNPRSIVLMGIAGSYHEHLPPGSLVRIEKEVPADQIAVRGDSWKYWHETGIPGTTETTLSPTAPSWTDKLTLPTVTGLTSDTITNNPATIKQRCRFFEADTESMEGAAIFFVAVEQKIETVQIRSISNYAREQDKKLWKMDEAIERLNTFVLEKIKPLLSQ